ncbi:hypothetical protein MUK42_15415 [Musa troglodytarum]|uniref:Uncharacterized protein n=1 Tax=Musa troglodytarum TaxID=320322 RepID=A0A9E7L126_9LILI|nr:hypothetical protein MUK42_15415 [Musa troglodytarum]
MAASLHASSYGCSALGLEAPSSSRKYAVDASSSTRSFTILRSPADASPTNKTIAVGCSAYKNPQSLDGRSSGHFGGSQAW